MNTNSKRSSLQQNITKFIARGSKTQEEIYKSLPQWSNKMKTGDLILKLFQVLISVTCAGLYTAGFHIVTDNIRMFPNIVFSMFIITTGFVVLGYVLGHMVPDTIVVIIDSLAIALFIASAIITTYYWVHYDSKENYGNAKPYSDEMLLSQVVLSYFNAFLYAIDIFLHIRRLKK